jgi:hypothetical protein
MSLSFPPMVGVWQQTENSLSVDEWGVYNTAVTYSRFENNRLAHEMYLGQSASGKYYVASVSVDTDSGHRFSPDIVETADEFVEARDSLLSLLASGSE